MPFIKGHKHTVETRKKMSEALKGREFSDEHRKRISEAKKGKPNGRKGYKHSAETLKKMSESQKGREFSDEHRKKIGEAKKGSTSFKGHKHTAAARKKTSEAILKKYQSEEYNLKLKESRKGRKLSPEHKKNIGKALKGENSPHWAGGITTERAIIRHSAECRVWRETIFARDNWTCKKCGKRTGLLNAHHIKNFNDHSELRFDSDNGVTFCKDCHEEFHRIYGYLKNNENQIILFLNSRTVFPLFGSGINTALPVMQRAARVTDWLEKLNMEAKNGLKGI